MEYIGDSTKLVSIMYTNNEIGTIQSIKELFGMRAGTENIASIVAMAIALEKNWREMEAIIKSQEILACPLEVLKEKCFCID